MIRRPITDHGGIADATVSVLTVLERAGVTVEWVHTSPAGSEMAVSADHWPRACAVIGNRNAQFLDSTTLGCVTLRRCTVQTARRRRGPKGWTYQYRVLAYLAEHPGAAHAAIGAALSLHPRTIRSTVYLLRRDRWLEPGSTILTDRGRRLVTQEDKDK